MLSHDSNENDDEHGEEIEIPPELLEVLGKSLQRELQAAKAEMETRYAIPDAKRVREMIPLWTAEGEEVVSKGELAGCSGPDFANALCGGFYAAVYSAAKVMSQ